MQWRWSRTGRPSGGSTMAESVLQGKVAIVTGAGSPIGIGHAITLGLIRAGARVAMLDINQAWLEQSAHEMRTVGGADCVLPIVADITDSDAVAQAVRRTITELGGLHILVNNAGTNPRAAGFEAAGQRSSSNFWDITPAAWHWVVAVNFTGAFLMAHEVVGHMLAQGWGRLIGVETSRDTIERKGAA